MSEDQVKEPTQEEIKEMRDRMHAYYTDQIPFLEAQKQYEMLLSEIEFARMRRIEATIRIAQLTTPPAEQAAPNEESNEPKVRTLKQS